MTNRQYDSVLALGVLLVLVVTIRSISVPDTLHIVVALLLTGVAIGLRIARGSNDA